MPLSSVIRRKTVRIADRCGRFAGGNFLNPAGQPDDSRFVVGLRSRRRIVQPGLFDTHGGVWIASQRLPRLNSCGGFRPISKMISVRAGCIEPAVLQNRAGDCDQLVRLTNILNRLDFEFTRLGAIAFVPNCHANQYGKTNRTGNNGIFSNQGGEATWGEDHCRQADNRPPANETEKSRQQNLRQRIENSPGWIVLVFRRVRRMPILHADFHVVIKVRQAGLPADPSANDGYGTSLEFIGNPFPLT